MEARLVTHNILSHATRRVGQLSVVLPLRGGEPLLEEFVQLGRETLLGAKQGDKVGNIVMHIPDVGPGVVLVVVGASTRATREDIVEGLDKLALGILGVEEASLRIEEVAIIETALDVEAIILLAASLASQLRNAPVVVRCSQRDGYCLTVLE